MSKDVKLLSSQINEIGFSRANTKLALKQTSTWWIIPPYLMLVTAIKKFVNLFNIRSFIIFHSFYYRTNLLQVHK